MFTTKNIVIILVLIVITTIFCVQNIKNKDFGSPATYLPIAERTPGEIDPAITQENIDKTICKSGYTATIRPPVSFTNKIKQFEIEDLDLDDKNMGDYELDHLISLQLGGSPTSTKNLWIEPYNGQYGARVKDKFETWLKRQVCARKITLKDAQNQISKNWIGYCVMNGVCK